MNYVEQFYNMVPACHTQYNITYMANNKLGEILSPLFCWFLYVYARKGIIMMVNIPEKRDPDDYDKEKFLKNT